MVKVCTQAGCGDSPTVMVITAEAAPEGILLLFRLLTQDQTVFFLHQLGLAHYKILTSPNLSE